MSSNRTTATYLCRRYVFSPECLDGGAPATVGMRPTTVAVAMAIFAHVILRLLGRLALALVLKHMTLAIIATELILAVVLAEQCRLLLCLLLRDVTSPFFAERNGSDTPSLKFAQLRAVLRRLHDCDCLKAPLPNVNFPLDDEDGVPQQLLLLVKRLLLLLLVLVLRRWMRPPP